MSGIGDERLVRCVVLFMQQRLPQWSLGKRLGNPLGSVSIPVRIFEINQRPAKILTHGHVNRGSYRSDFCRNPDHIEANSRPSCLRPISTAGKESEGASMMPLLEFPMIAMACFIRLQ